MVGARIATTVGGYFNGQVAEAAVYGAALTTEEIEMLAAGYSPLMVRPQSLVLYAPLFGRNGAAGGEEEWVGGRTLTQTSSPALYDHPRIIYPRRSIWVPKASAGGGGAATVTPTIIASTASFGSATVARTAVAAVTTARIASTASIGAHTVARTGVAAVTPSRIASTVSFGTATVTRTAVAAVSPTRIASTASIGAHVVTVAGMGAVSAARIESTVSFGAATVTRSAVHSIQPGRIDSSVTFGVPVVTSSTPQIFVGRIASTAAVYAPPVVRTGPVVAASEYRRFSSAFATSRTLASAITQTVTLASAIDLE